MKDGPKYKNVQFQYAQNSQINTNEIPPVVVVPFVAVDVVVEVTYCVVVDAADVDVEVMDADVVVTVGMFVSKQKE